MSLTRRDFIATAGASVMAATTGLARDGQSGQRPNIVMVFSNDITRRDFGCYGNEVVKTPNIDRLSREGMTFTNVFTSSPQCAPSRAALYTGLYPIRNGAHPNHSDVKPGIRSMAHYMRALGYRPVVTGVTHIRPWAESFPFETMARGQVAALLANPGPKPICLIMCEFGAHDMWPNPKNLHPYEPETLDIPSYQVDTPETRAHRARYYSNITETDVQVGRLLEQLKQAQLEDKTLFVFAADHGTGWPHEKLTLYDAGINIPFIVRWPGRVAAGTRSDALCSIVDVLPTFMEAAGGNVAQVVADAGGEPLDGRSFLPVLLGQRPEHHSEVYGVFTWDVMVAYPMRAIRTRTHKYIWNIDSHFAYPSRYAADDPHSAGKGEIWQSWVRKAATDPHAAARVPAELFRPSEELYDIRRDPHEMENLAARPEHQAVLSSIRDTLKAWMRQQGDAGDSAYHRETALGSIRFLDEIYCRQPVINCGMKAVRAAPGADFTDHALVTLSSPVWVAAIHYTLDGSDPTPASSLYSRPFDIGPPGPPTTIKAKGFWKGGETPVKTVAFTGVDCRFRYHSDHWRPKSW